ncbi:hypothetical protein MP638_002558 [Amoeboaphelidium occidentale]|nr:hypothetical protein MP638_002558 [Amoeboaphelidium occidentale]
MMVRLTVKLSLIAAVLDVSLAGLMQTDFFKSQQCDYTQWKGSVADRIWEQKLMDGCMDCMGSNPDMNICKGGAMKICNDGTNMVQATSKYEGQVGTATLYDKDRMALSQWSIPADGKCTPLGAHGSYKAFMANCTANSFMIFNSLDCSSSSLLYNVKLDDSCSLLTPSSGNSAQSSLWSGTCKRTPRYESYCGACSSDPTLKMPCLVQKVDASPSHEDMVHHSDAISSLSLVVFAAVIIVCVASVVGVKYLRKSNVFPLNKEKQGHYMALQ